MIPHKWWLFVAAVFMLSGTPGPNMIHVMTRSARFGLRRSVAAMAGCLSALIFVVSASSAGLAAFLTGLPGLFEILRFFGIAYLIYLGVNAWRGADAPLTIATDQILNSLSAGRLFRDGFFVSVSNPKLLLFASAFMPQFVSPSEPHGPQLTILAATFTAIELFWYTIYGVSGQTIASYLQRESLRRIFNRVAGSLFIGFGATLIGMRP